METKRLFECLEGSLEGDGGRAGERGEGEREVGEGREERKDSRERMLASRLGSSTVREDLVVREENGDRKL